MSSNNSIRIICYFSKGSNRIHLFLKDRSESTSVPIVGSGILVRFFSKGSDPDPIMSEKGQIRIHISLMRIRNTALQSQCFTLTRLLMASSSFTRSSPNPEVFCYCINPFIAFFQNQNLTFIIRISGMTRVRLESRIFGLFLQSFTF